MADTAKTDGAERARVLVVDLDGTLSRTDTLHEALLAILFSKPGRIFDLLRWVRGGKAAFKARVADLCTRAAADLPLNEDVVALVQEARAAGRKTALVSASAEAQVTRIADETGLFDEAHGSSPARNLKGAEKRAFLDGTYGAGNWDYVGDSAADLDVWPGAGQAIAVAPTDKVRRDLRRIAPEARVLAGANLTNAFVRAIRPYQWSKNLLVFLPMLAAHRLDVLPVVTFAALAFSAMASSAYLINDLGDLAADRAHPRKRNRPFAAGHLSLATGVIAAVALIVIGTALGLATGSPLFLGALFTYLAATLSYSFWLKRRAVIDILVLSGLYTLRIIGGALAAAVVLSPWMLGFSLFLFLALAAVKRQTELGDQETDGELAGRGYTTEDLPVIRGIATSSANGAVVVFALYLSSPAVALLYSRPALLWAVCPLLLYWLYRMVFKAHRGMMTDDPIVFAAKDKVSLGVIGASALLTALAI